jgi:hypothetical protein
MPGPDRRLFVAADILDAAATDPVQQSARTFVMCCSAFFWLLSGVAACCWLYALAHAHEWNLGRVSVILAPWMAAALLTALHLRTVARRDVDVTADEPTSDAVRIARLGDAVEGKLRSAGLAIVAAYSLLIVLFGLLGGAAERGEDRVLLLCLVGVVLVAYLVPAALLIRRNTGIASLMLIVVGVATLPFGMVAIFAGIGIRWIMRLRQRCATPA